MARKKDSGGGCLLAIVAAVLAIGYYQGEIAPPASGGSGDSGDSGTAYVAPADGRLVSGYGARSGGMHYGLDIAAGRGEPIRAVADGTVIEAGPATGFGLWVRIEHGGGTVTVYGHMHTITVDQGEQVDAGEQIATVGSRGQSTGPHLHFEVWPHGQRSQRTDPQPWLAEHGVHL